MVPNNTYIFRTVIILILSLLFEATTLSVSAQIGDLLPKNSEVPTLPFSQTTEFIPLSQELAEQLTPYQKKWERVGNEEDVNTRRVWSAVSEKHTQLPEDSDDVYWQTPIPTADNFEFWKVRAIAVSGSRIYVGGEFSRAGNLSVNNIAWYDTLTNEWGTLGEGVDRPVRHLAAANGKVYVEGSFSMIGEKSIERLAQWDEATEEWSDLEGGLQSDTYVSINDMDTDAEGNLYVAGNFEQAGSTVVSNIAMWDGERWHDLQGGVEGIIIIDIEVADSRVYVGGVIYSAGSVSVAGVALWDGSSWSAVGSLSFQAQIRLSKIIATQNSVVVVGGVLGTTSKDEFVTGIIWSGTDWNGLTDFISPFGERPRSISNAVFSANGDLLVVGDFDRIGNIQASNFAVLRNAVWSELPLPDYCEISSFGTIHLLHLVLETFGSEYLIGGTFSRVGEQVLTGVARLKGEGFRSLGTGVRGSKVDGDAINTAVTALVAGPDGELYFGGKFSKVAGVIASNVAKWDQDMWHPMGDGVNIVAEITATTIVTELQVAPDGTLYAAGSFNRSGKVANSGVVRWNGEQWLPVFHFPWSNIQVLRFSPDGTLYAAGHNDDENAIVARLEGDSWQVLDGMFFEKDDQFLSSGRFYDITFDGETTYVAGEFNSIQLNNGDSVHAFGVAEWSGKTWEPLGQGVRSVNDQFPDLSFISIAKALVLSGDSLFVGGEFNRAGNVEVANLAVWDTRTEVWGDMGGGIADLEEPIGKTVNDMVKIGDELFVVGGFDHVAGVPAQNIAMWDGAAWNPLGSGIEMLKIGTLVKTRLVVDRAGNLFVVSDHLSKAGDKDARYVAQWSKPTLSVSTEPSQFMNHQVHVLENPVQDYARFQLALAKPASVQIRIYSISGEYLGTVIDDVYEPGEYQVEWDVTTVPSGTYLYTVEAGDEQSSGRVVVLRN